MPRRATRSCVWLQLCLWSCCALTACTVANAFGPGPYRSPWGDLSFLKTSSSSDFVQFVSPLAQFVKLSYTATNGK